MFPKLLLHFNHVIEAFRVVKKLGHFGIMIFKKIGPYRLRDHFRHKLFNAIGSTFLAPCRMSILDPQLKMLALP